MPPGNKKRILHIITAFGYGGAEKLLVNVVNEQIKLHEVTICILKPPVSLQHLLDPRVHIQIISLDFFTVFKIRAIVSLVKPDIVHTHLGHADLLSMIACWLKPGKYFCTMHNIWFKKKVKDRVFFIAYFILLHTLGRKFTLIAISRSVQEHLQSTFYLPPCRNVLIYNAINLRSLKHFERPGGIRESFNMLFIGRLTIQKNLDFLIRSTPDLLKLIPSLKLYIVGDGELRFKLENLAIILNLEDVVHFVGVSDDPGTFFSKADCLVLPSRFEGFGLVILEAFFYSVPVVASDIEGPKELISDGETGFLFEVNNRQNFIEKVMILYKDKSLSERIAAQANKEVYKFSIDAYIEKLEQLYSRT